MLTSLRQLEGLPTVWQDRLVGYVERGVPDEDALRLNGLVIRKGLGPSKWVGADSISSVGKRCILLRGKPQPLSGQRIPELHLAYLTTGQRIGPITDGLLSSNSLRMLALEISPGPLYHLCGKNAYARDFHVISKGLRCGQAMVNGLLNWTELISALGKEEHTWI